MGHLGAVEVILKQKDGHIGPADALHRPLEAQPGTWQRGQPWFTKTFPGTMGGNTGSVEQ